jgi:hypothetical protein
VPWARVAKEKEMNEYTPELGQYCYGNAYGQYEMPQYAIVLLQGILQYISITVWNRDQVEWDKYTDPGIPGIEYRPYWWGNEDAPEATMPNLGCGGVKVFWYKYPGRGMSVDKNLSPAEWAEWFNACLAAIDKVDPMTNQE